MKIEDMALQADAKKVLTQMTRIMMHPAVENHSWTTNDLEKVTKALDALTPSHEPTSQVGRLMKERRMAAIEDGLFWSAQMLERIGFQAAKGVAWQEADQQATQEALEGYQRLTAHQRN